MEQKPEETARAAADSDQKPAEAAKPPAENSAETTAGGMQAESLEGTTDATGDPANGSQKTSKASGGNGLKKLLSRVNIYFLLFLLMLLIAVMALVIGMQRSRKEANPTDITGQTLSPDAINELQGNDIKIGDVKQTLSVESNAVFAGRILVQGGVEIAGSLKVGGTTSLIDLAVAGSGNFQQIQANELAISGNAGIQGQLTIQKSINVTGGGSFGGAVSIPHLTADTLQLTNDLQLIRHIDAGGGTPDRSNGSALGGGGTSSVSGTDTAGTVNISTGNSPPGGCFVTLTFAQAFSATPHVVISPVGSASGGLDYYITRTSTSFSICATNPVAGTSYAFDYIVID